MESTLSLTLTDLQAEVGHLLGYTRGLSYGETVWDARQQSDIDSCVKSGLRNFYFPQPLRGEGASYNWSFLKPVATIAFSAGSETVMLPDDFGGFEGQITIATSGSNSYGPISLVGIGSIYESSARSPSTTGRPMHACLEPIKGTSQSRGQKSQLRIYPTSDQAYTLQFAYYILADALSIAAPYAYGGMAHAETILESCLAVAEKRIEDESTVHATEFLNRLAASINLDRRLKPQTLGYNGDRSDGRWMNRGDQHYQGSVLVGGVGY